MKPALKIIIGCAIILLGTLLFLYMGKKGNETPEVAKNQPPLVLTTLAAPTSIPYRMEVTATANAKNKIELYSEVQGVLLPVSRHFKEGNSFSKNKVLLQLDNSEYLAQLQSNKSSLVNQIAAMLPDMEIEYPIAAAKWERYLKDFQLEGPLQSLPKTASDAEKLFVSGKGIYQSFYSVKNQQERAAKYTIRAPFSGTVTQSLVNPGTLVRSGQKLGEFIAPTVFELSLAIPAAGIKYIQEGQKVQLSLLATNHIFIGTIVRLNPKVDQATQTVNAIVEVRDDQLRDGQYVSAIIEGASLKDVVKMKANLLLENDHVYIVQDSVLTLQKVVPLNYIKDSVVVKGVTKESILLDQVLANAYPGMKVNY